MRAIVVVGNPKPASRTLDAAVRLATALGARPEVLEVSSLGPGLLGWGDPIVKDAVSAVAGADMAVFASPTFKASYSGLLKLFLDQFETGTGLENVIAIPLMLGAGAAHALAPEVFLKPVLVELGATCPTQGLYQLDKQYLTDGSLSQWVDRWGKSVSAALTAQEA